MITQTSNPGHLPLAGMKVMEVSQIMAGPTCGLMLSDMGADIVKIEKFPAGDDARHYSGPNDAALPPSFMMINRGKRSLAIDVRTDRGRKLLLSLVPKFDVVTENFRKGVVERLGIHYDAMRVINPALIYCSISGYGRTGPLADKGGFDLILQAFAGLIDATGHPGGPPTKPAVSIADINAGIIAALGITAAYVHRLKTGEGQRVDTSLMQAAMHQTFWFSAYYFARGELPQKLGTAHALIAPYEVLDCADGGIAIGGGNQNSWLKITDILGHPEWKVDPRFLTPQNRVAHRGELAHLLNDVLRTNTVAHWLALFDAAGVPAGPLNTVADAVEHPQARAVNMVIDVDHPLGGRTRSLGSPVLFDGRSAPGESAAPLVGQHTREVLRENGILDGDIESLLRDGIVHEPASRMALAS